MRVLCVCFCVYEMSYVFAIRRGGNSIFDFAERDTRSVFCMSVLSGIFEFYLLLVVLFVRCGMDPLGLQLPL